MKIVFCVPSLGKGGAERVVSNLANYLSSHNDDVLIIVNTKNNIAYKIDDDVRLIELDGRQNTNVIIKNWLRLKRLKKNVLDFRPDVIVSFLPMPSFRVLLLKKKLRCKVIVTDRNDPKEEYSKFLINILMRLLYPKADGFVFQTKEQKNYFNKKIQGRSVIIANPLKEDFLRDNNKKRKKDIIVNVGRLVEQKNQKLLIDSFGIISRKHPNYRLKIYGDGPLKNELVHQISDLNLSDKVEICGTVDNIKEKLDEARIFVLSSNYEGLPNSLLEAMSCGLACISSNCPCGGPKEIINNNINGILFDVGNSKALTKAIDYLIANEDKRKEIEKEALMVRKKFDPSIINRNWQQYIERVVSNE